MHKKRQSEARTIAREFDLYEKEDVKERDTKFKTVDPSTREERTGKLAHRGWKAYHNLRWDPQLGENEAMLRRWPCSCAPCRAQLSSKSLTKRYAPSEGCLMRPVFGTLNDWKKVSFVEDSKKTTAVLERSGEEEDEEGDDLEDAAEEIEDEEDEDDASELEDDEFAAIEYTDRVADGIERGDRFAIPAPRDPGYPGYYILEALSTAYELTAPEPSDYGVLEVGTRVIDAFFYNLAFKPDRKPRLWTPMNPPTKYIIPTHLLLVAGFEMPRAPPLPEKASVQHRSAVAKGAVVLADDVHDDALQELTVREDRGV